jgi:alpha-methylacyl-CoA racemase
MAGPLAGCRIIEMAGLGPGPFAAMLLADLGAEVIRVERVGARPAAADKYVMHRGRRSIAVDVKHPDGRDVLLGLSDRADALIEVFRPGVMERLGLGPADCRRRNPRLVYGRMTGWGQEGPLAPTAGHDIDYIAISGALGCVARAGERPVVPVNFLGDFGGGGLFLALGIVAAMWEATRSGEGQVVDAAMVDGSAVITTMLHGLLAQGRWRDEAGVNFSDGGSNYYDTYVCADDRHIAVGAIEGPFYAALLRGLGYDRDELPDRADPSNWPVLKERFATRFRSKTRDEWAKLFEGTDACVAPVLGLTEAAHHPHNVARGVFVEREGIVQPAPAPRFDRTPSELDRLPPAPGQHTRELLREHGYDDSGIARLIETGAVADAANGSTDQ